MWPAKCTRFIVNAGLVVAVACGPGISAQINDEVNEVPEPYAMDQGYFMLPAGRMIGNTAGITLDNDGTIIWVYDACGGTSCVGSDLDPVLKFDASGRFETSFGAGVFIRPHGIHIDPEGNIG